MFNTQEKSDEAFTMVREGKYMVEYLNGVPTGSGYTLRFDNAVITLLKYITKCTNYGKYTIALIPKDIAPVLAMATATLYYALSKLRKAGTISTKVKRENNINIMYVTLIARPTIGE